MSTRCTRPRVSVATEPRYGAPSLTTPESTKSSGLPADGLRRLFGDEPEQACVAAPVRVVDDDDARAQPALGWPTLEQLAQIDDRHRRTPVDRRCPPPPRALARSH